MMFRIVEINKIFIFHCNSDTYGFRESHLCSLSALVDVPMAVFTRESRWAFAEEGSFCIMTLTITFAWRQKTSTFALVNILATLSPITPFVAFVTKTSRSLLSVGAIRICAASLSYKSICTSLR